MNSQPITPHSQPVAAAVPPLVAAAATSPPVASVPLLKQAVSHADSDEEEQELCSSSTLLLSDPFVRKAWSRLRARLAHRAYQRRVLEATSTTATTSTSLRSLSLGHSSSTHLHSSRSRGSSSIVSSGSKSKSSSSSRVRQTYAYSQEKATVHERSRQQQGYDDMPPQCFLAHCLQAWGYPSSSSTNTTTTTSILSPLSFSFSSSCSSSPSSSFFTSSAPPVPSALLLRVGEAWFLRRWLMRRWQPRGQRHHHSQISQRFHHENIAHCVLGALFLNRRRKRYARLERKKADAFHARRLVAWWEPLAKERRRRQQQQQQEFTIMNDLCVSLPGVDIMLQSNSFDSASLSLSSPFSSLPMPLSSAAVDAGPGVEGASSFLSLLGSSSSSSDDDDDDDDDDYDRHSFLLPPPLELRLLQHRVLAALDANRTRNTLNRNAEILANKHPLHRYLRRWARLAHTHTLIHHAHLIAKQGHELHTFQKAFPLLLLRTNTLRLQSLCTHTASLAWARRRATTTLWKLSLRVGLQKFHRNAIEIMLQSQCLWAVTRAMSLLYAPAQKMLLHLQTYTRHHHQEACQRALQRWHHRAAAAAVARQQQQKAINLHMSTSLHRALLQRWHRLVTSQRQQQQVLTFATSHVSRLQVRVALQALLEWKRKAFLLAHVAVLGRRTRLRRVVCAWASVVRRKGELRALELALTCRNELLVLQRVFGVIKSRVREQARIMKTFDLVSRQREERVGREVLGHWWRRARVQEYEGERFEAFVHTCLTAWMLWSQMQRGRRRAWEEGVEHYERRVKGRALRWWREERRKRGERMGGVYRWRRRRRRRTYLKINYHRSVCAR